MRRISVSNSVTLDGVMQAPAAPDEDRRDGFEHGGWALPYFDPVMVESAGVEMGRESNILLGRRTYEHFARVWPHMPDDNPFTKTINNARKLVVSNSLSEPLAWNNSSLLRGDATDSVRALKAEEGPDVVILGSGELIRSLIAHDLIDEFRLLIHPLVLGSGRRMFDDGLPLTRFTLADSTPTTTGVIIARYRLTHEPPTPAGAQQAEPAREAVANR
jgi:dihydrofolate reductase